MSFVREHIECQKKPAYPSLSILLYFSIINYLTTKKIKYINLSGVIEIDFDYPLIEVGEDLN